MAASLPVLAGVVATVIFAGSTMPMLVKALRTRDLGSYSLGNLLLANLGNAVHSVYVFSLPPGPLWALHAFNLASSAFMLTWYLRFELLTTPRSRRTPSPPARPRTRPDADHPRSASDQAQPSGSSQAQPSGSGQAQPSGVDDDGAPVGHVELGQDRRDVMVGGLR